jgi:hypothetical protein
VSKEDSIIQDGATAPIQHVVPSELCLRITSYGMKDERLGTSSSLWLDGANFLGTVDAQKLAKGLQAALEMTAMARAKENPPQTAPRPHMLIPSFGKSQTAIK